MLPHEIPLMWGDGVDTTTLAYGIGRMLHAFHEFQNPEHKVRNKKGGVGGAEGEHAIERTHYPLNPLFY
jgi:hypothetical protein